MITKEMIVRGLFRKDILAFVKDGEHDPACQMGGDWFWFGCDREGPEDPKEYLESLSLDQMVDAIYAALESFIESENPEDYDAYVGHELYLRKRDDMVSKPFVVDIEEVNRKKVIVYAMSSAEAKEVAENLYADGEIDLTRNCYDGVRFDAIRAGRDDVQSYDVYGEEG